MKITFKRTNNEYVVTVNGHPYSFDTSKDAWTFIIAIRNEVA